MVNCCYKGCKNDSRLSDRDYMLGIYFLTFPKPKTQLEKCKRWIAACSRPEFLTLDKITKHRYVCSFHFAGGKGPTKLNPDPLPYHEYCIDDTHNTCSISSCSTTELTDPDVDKALLDSVVSDAVLTNSLALHTNDNDASIENESVVNKIQLMELKNITDLHRRYIEYQYYRDSEELTWTISKSGDSTLSFLKMTTPYICVIEVKILSNLEFDIYIYGKKLLKPHCLLTSDKAPQTISNLNDLIRLISYLESLAVCNGCGDAAKNWSFSEKYGFLNIYTKELHSQKCQGLTLNTAYPRCNSCKIFRKSQISKSKKLKIAELTESKNYQGTYTYASKSKDDLIELLKQKTSNFKALKRKNTSLVFMLEKTKSKLRDALAGGNNALFGEPNYEDPFCSNDNFLRIVLSEQAKLLKMNLKRPKQWHPAIIKWCLYLRAKSPSTYDTLRDVLPLPSSRTLLNYYSEFTCDSGFTAEALSEMREKIYLNNVEHPKYSMVADEINIKDIKEEQQEEPGPILG